MGRLIRVTHPTIHEGQASGPAGIVFVDGQAVVDTAKLPTVEAFFHRHGYGVEDVDTTTVAEAAGPVDSTTLGEVRVEVVPVIVGEPGPELVHLASGGEVPAGTVVTVGEHPPPSRGASTDVWRTWAVEHGGLSADEAATLSRDQLADRFAPKSE